MVSRRSRSGRKAASPAGFVRMIGSIRPTGPARRAGLVLATLVLAGLVLTGGPVRGQGVTVALTPSVVQVPPGGQFDLDLTVTVAGALFNGFDAIIGYDPAAVSLVAFQEGSLMLDACGNTFPRFRVGASSDTINEVLMCPNLSLTGPGQIYHLRFQAAETPQETVIQLLPGLRFYNAGLYVEPVFSSDALIQIGLSDSGLPVRGSGSGMELRIMPNPGVGSVRLFASGIESGPVRLSVLDLQGRLLRRFEVGKEGTRGWECTWDGSDLRGRLVPGGVYFAKLEAAGRSLVRRISLLR